MILGFGVDLTNVARIEKLIENPKFINRVFTKEETKYCEARGVQKAQSFAARFSVKEAFLKAIGTGLRGGKLVEIEVINDELGKPSLNLFGYFAKYTKEKGMTNIHVSISHLQEYALAEVIIEDNSANNLEAPFSNLVNDKLKTPIDVLESWADQGVLVTKSFVKRILAPRTYLAHKGMCGKVLVVAGSPGFTGAAALSSFASVKTGAGLVTLVTMPETQSILAIKLDEVMVQSAASLEPILEWTKKVEALAIGPGFGTGSDRKKLCRDIMMNANKSIVIDADALTSLVGHTELLNLMHGDKILTPHVGELARLTGFDVSYINENRAEIAKKYAIAWNCVLVLKGAGSIIATPKGEVYINTSGNSAMATGGSGDVLTGILVALLAQGMSVKDAAIAGVFMHGLAGEIASKDRIGLAAGEISLALPEAREVIEGND